MPGILELMRDPETRENAKGAAFKGAIAAAVGVGMIIIEKSSPDPDEEIGKIFSYGLQGGGVLLIGMGGIIFVGCSTLLYLASQPAQPQLEDKKVPSHSQPIPPIARNRQAQRYKPKTKISKGWIPTMQGVNEYYQNLSERFSVKKVHEHGQAFYAHLKETVSFREYFSVNKVRQHCYSLYSKYFKTETLFQDPKKKKKPTRKENQAIDENRRERVGSSPMANNGTQAELKTGDGLREDENPKKKRKKRTRKEDQAIDKNQREPAGSPRIMNNGAQAESKTDDGLREDEISGESTKDSTLKIQEKLIIESRLSQVTPDFQKDQSELKDKKVVNVIKAQQDQIASLLQENEKLKGLSRDTKYSEENRKKAESLSKELEEKLKKAYANTQFQAIESNRRENFLQNVIYRQGLLLHDLARRVNQVSLVFVPVSLSIMVTSGPQPFPLSPTAPVLPGLSSRQSRRPNLSRSLR